MSGAERETSACEGCKGDGTLTVTSGGLVIASMSPCPLCGGTGEQRKR